MTGVLGFWNSASETFIGMAVYNEHGMSDGYQEQVDNEAMGVYRPQ